MLLDENEFRFTRGMWIVRAKPTQENEGLWHWSIARASNDDRKCAAVFSDEHLAERFIERHSDELKDSEELAPFRYNNKSEVAKFLFLLSGMGITHVAIDPEKHGPAKRIAVAAFLQSAWDGCGDVVFDP